MANPVVNTAMCTCSFGVAPAVLPAVFSIYFDLFDGLIQTVVFVFLTTLFTGEGIKEEE